MPPQIGLLLDYTRSADREQRLRLLEHFTRYKDTMFIILYGIRAYPLCEFKCMELKGADYYSIPDLDGPPEPYRAVKEAVELARAYGLNGVKLLLVWSAPRKPLVDLRIAFNYAENSGLEPYLIIIRPHSSTWLTKSLRYLDDNRVLIARRRISVEKIIEFSTRETHTHTP